MFNSIEHVIRFFRGSAKRYAEWGQSEKAKQQEEYALEIEEWLKTESRQDVIFKIGVKHCYEINE